MAYLSTLGVKISIGADLMLRELASCVAEPGSTSSENSDV